MDNADAAIFREFGITPVARTPVLSDTERRAYQAAWRIDREQVPETLDSLACKSARHARYIDHMARIMAEEFGR